MYKITEGDPHTISVNSKGLTEWLKLVGTKNCWFLISPNLGDNLDHFLQALGIPTLRQGIFKAIHIPPNIEANLMATILIGTHRPHLPPALPSYPIPKSGSASPQVLCVDVNQNEIDRHAWKLLNKGLGFVPRLVRSEIDLEDLYKQIDSQIPIPFQHVKNLKTKLMENRTKAFKYAKDVSNIQISRFRSLGNKFVIKPSDKGGRIVIMSKEFYANAISKLLNTTDYEELSGPPDLNLFVSKICMEIKSYLKSKISPTLKGKIARTLKDTSEKEKRFGFFYGLPKIHKNLRDPPMRPVVSQVNHPTAPLAILVDKIIQKSLFRENPHLLKSTDHAISKFIKINLTNAKFISLDVKSLYTSIPIEEGISAVWLESAAWDIPFEDRIVLKDATRMVIENNYFSFGNRHFKQVKGVAMGSPLGPSFANTFLLYIDRIIKNYQGVIDYFRYIDDILIIGDINIESNDLVSFANSINPSIQFEFVEDGSTVDYLDLTLCIREGNLTFSIYEKEISSWSRYISSESLHKSRMLEGISIGAIKRTLKLCSDPLTAIYHLENTVFPRLREKGLSYKSFSECLKKSINQKDEIPDKNDLTLRIVLDANPESSVEPETIRNWLRETSISCGSELKIKPQIVYKNYPSNRKLVVKAKYSDKL